MSGIELDPDSPPEIQKDAIGNMETRQPIKKAALIPHNPIPTEWGTVFDSLGIIEDSTGDLKKFFWTTG